MTDYKEMNIFGNIYAVAPNANIEVLRPLYINYMRSHKQQVMREYRGE